MQIFAYRLHNAKIYHDSFGMSSDAENDVDASDVEMDTFDAATE